MGEFWNAAGSSALVIVVAGVVAGAIAFCLRTWIAALIGSSIAHHFNLTLEDQKDQMKRLTDQLNAVQSTANAALVEGQRASAEWRLKAVDTLWREVLRLRSETSPVLFLLDILTINEHNRSETVQRLKPMVPRIEDLTNLISSEIEAVRPFLGEETYALFFSYRAIAGRIIVLIENDLKEGRVGRWYEDTGVRELMGVVFTSEELRQFDAVQVMRVQWTLNAMEAKILERLRQVIAGEVSTEEGLARAERTLEVVQRLDATERAARQSQQVT